MTRRRPVLLVASAAGMVAAVACTFPAIGYRDAASGGAAGAPTGSAGSTSIASSSSGVGGASASSTSSGSTGGGSATSTGGSGGSGSGGSGGGGASSSASTSSTSSSNASSSGCLKPCDCDGDGDNAATAECGFDGGDCNDHDPDVSSKQTKWFTKPGSNGWDYNCSGQAEYEFTDVLDCWFFGCDGNTDKWVSSQPVPGCGDAGTYGTCQGWPSCSEQPDGMRVQGCH